MSKHSIVLLVISIFALSATAKSDSKQDDDFGVWTSIDVAKQMNKRLNIGFEGEFRSNNNLKSVERWSGALYASYKLSKYFKIGADYNLLYRYTNSESKVKSEFTDKGNYKETTKYYPAYWQTSHRFGAYITGSYKVGKLTFSLRERVQYTTKTGDSIAYSKTKVVYDGTSADDDVKKTEKSIGYKDITGNKCQLRSRLQVEYNIRKCAFTPYASAELYNNLSDGFSGEKWRYTVGTEYKINKNNKLELYYRYQYIMDDDPNNNVIGVGYSLKF